jgi:hypothetical protein
MFLLYPTQCVGYRRNIDLQYNLQDIYYRLYLLLTTLGIISVHNGVLLFKLDSNVQDHQSSHL